jgi:hypothetical protein
MVVMEAITKTQGETFDNKASTMYFNYLLFNFPVFFSEWDGMMKELLEQRADMAIADLTITFEREQVCINY